MEIMTIESNAYRLLVEKIEKITATWRNPGTGRKRSANGKRKRKALLPRDGKPTRSG